MTLPAHPAIHEALDASAGNVVLDGTAHLQDVRHWLAPSHPADVSAARTTTDNGIEHVIAFQVTGGGKFPSNRREPANDHRDRIIAAIHQRMGGPDRIGVIDFAKHVREGWGSWFNASRGTNAFASCHTLILVGKPNIALAAGKSQFAVAQRNDPENLNSLNAAFGSWYVRRTAEEITQAIHRLRPAQRPPEEGRTVFLLCDADRGDIGRPILPLPAAALSWAAGSPAHQLLHEALRILQANPRMPHTQAAVAEALIAAGALGIKPEAKPHTVGRRLKRAIKSLDASWDDFIRHALAFAWDSPE
jgi:hypothetical protein